MVTAHVEHPFLSLSLSFSAPQFPTRWSTTSHHLGEIRVTAMAATNQVVPKRYQHMFFFFYGILPTRMNMHGDYIMILSDLIGCYIKRGGAPDRLQSWLATSATGIYIYIYM